VLLSGYVVAGYNVIRSEQMNKHGVVGLAWLKPPQQGKRTGSVAAVGSPAQQSQPVERHRQGNTTPAKKAKVEKVPLRAAEKRINESPLPSVRKTLVGGGLNRATASSSGLA
jgi:hypothetical protein